MPRLNKLLTGHDITDEVINRTASTSLKLDHDTMLASSVVVRTAAGGGGTLLTLTTDYTLGNEDTDLSTEVGGGAHVYTTLAVVNGAYHSTDLYVTYKTVGDYASMESVMQIAAPVGSGMEWYAATAPNGWLLQQGQAISRTTYAELFGVIGTVWGVGDGSTTFNLPDRRESSGYGAGTYSAVTGTTHGAITAHDALALGAFGDDRGQGHKHGAQYPDYATNQTFTSGGASLVSQGSGAGAGAFAYTQISDGPNGTPRTGATTRGKIIGVNYIIKY